MLSWDAFLGLLRVGLDTDLWAFSSERSPTLPSPFVSSVTGPYHRAFVPCNGSQRTAHKWSSNPTVTPDALTLSRVSIHAAAALCSYSVLACNAREIVLARGVIAVYTILALFTLVGFGGGGILIHKFGRQCDNYLETPDLGFLVLGVFMVIFLPVTGFVIASGMIEGAYGY